MSEKSVEVDQYIAGFPLPMQLMLEQLRSIIRETAPEAKEMISYGMPAYKLQRILLYFAGHNKHIGFYPLAAAIELFKDQLPPFKWSKGAIQFPADKPLPTELIRQIILFRLEDLAKKRKK